MLPWLCFLFFSRVCHFAAVVSATEMGVFRLCSAGGGSEVNRNWCTYTLAKRNVPKSVVGVAVVVAAVLVVAVLDEVAAAAVVVAVLLAAVGEVAAEVVVAPAVVRMGVSGTAAIWVKATEVEHVRFTVPL